MTQHRSILDNCFSSSSTLWKEFLQEDEELNTLYYPSAGEDLRPFAFSKKECLNYTGANINQDSYREPNFFIFSDYFIGTRSKLFDTRILHFDAYTSIYIEDFCELNPKSPAFIYNFNREYVAFDAAPMTGKAIFFKARIESHVLKDSFERYGVYFLYENVNLIEQLFLKHNLEINHLVWNNDGCGLGGGALRHHFLMPVSNLLKTQYYFIANTYLKDKKVELNNKFLKESKIPEEIKPYLPETFNLNLEQKGFFNWNGYERVNFYEKVITKELQHY